MNFSEQEFLLIEISLERKFLEKKILRMFSGKESFLNRKFQKYFFQKKEIS